LSPAAATSSPCKTSPTGGRFVLIAGEDGRAWVEAAHTIAENTGTVLTAVTVGADDSDLADVRLAWLRKRQIGRDGAVLVRPDRYVGFRSVGAVDNPLSVLSAALEQILAVDKLRAAR
jgi:2,4-dichlorophenol 6-monooxygenase